jgi:membrane associated rhomboid family serine protease
MVILNFASSYFLTFFTQKQLLGVYVLSACWYCICIGYSILNLSASIVGASAAIMGILVAVTTYQPLMNVRLLLLGM